MRDDNKWRGNTYLPNDPYGSLYNFSNDDNMGDWEFNFDGGLQTSVTIQGQTYHDVYAIQEDDELDPVTAPSDFGSLTLLLQVLTIHTKLDLALKCGWLTTIDCIG